MRLHKTNYGKFIGGVCAGIAETIGIDILYIRLLFLFLLIYAGSTFWIYLVLWVILPTIDLAGSEHRQSQFYRSRSDRMVSGVCGGLATALSTDPTVIRLVFIGLALLGLASVVPYLVLWLITPLEPYQ